MAEVEQKGYKDDVGDTQYIMGYYSSRGLKPLLSDEDDRNLIFADDKYGKIKFHITYFYDEFQNCTDMLIDLRKVYKSVKKFREIGDYDDFIDEVCDRNPDFSTLSYKAYYNPRGDYLDQENNYTSLIHVVMEDYPDHGEESNALAHFADVLVDLVESLNDMLGKKVDNRNLKQIYSLAIRFNPNGFFYLFMFLFAGGIAAFVIGLINSLKWLWIIGLIVMIIHLIFLGLALPHFISDYVYFKKENFIKTNCQRPQESRLK